MEEMKTRREDWPVWARELLAGIHMLHQDAKADREEARADRKEQRQHFDSILGEFGRRTDKMAKGMENSMKAILHVGRDIRKSLHGIEKKLEKLDKLDEILGLLRHRPGPAGNNGQGAA